MDLSFRQFVADGPAVTALIDLPVLLVATAGRQSASPTAMVEARCAVIHGEYDLLAPAPGAFSPATARLIAGWQKE